MLCGRLRQPRGLSRTPTGPWAGARADRRRRSGDEDGLHLAELLQTEAAQLAAVAGLLGTTEGEFGGRGDHGVDEAHAYVEPLDTLFALGLVGGPDAGAESER